MGVAHVHQNYSDRVRTGQANEAEFYAHFNVPHDQPFSPLENNQVCDAPVVAIRMRVLNLFRNGLLIFEFS